MTWRNPVDTLQNLPGDPPLFLYTTVADPGRLVFLGGVVESLVGVPPSSGPGPTGRGWLGVAYR